MQTIAITRCPGCGGDSSSTVLLGAHALRRCDGCSVVFATEYARPEDIYVEGYLTGGGEFGPPNALEPSFQRFLVAAGHRRLDLVDRTAGRPRTLLDVGCGTGDVVAAATERGIDAAGVEPVEESARAAVARGLDVRAAMLEDSGLPEGSFDVVTAYHVLEHMVDATEFLRLITRWARPGGHVVVEVPNWGSMARRRDRDSWIGLKPLEHVGHYTTKTLRATVARAGLDVVAVRSMGFLWPEQTFSQALSTVGLAKLRRRLRRLARPEQRDGRQVLVPRAATWHLLEAAARACDLAGAGQVVTAVGRV